MGSKQLIHLARHALSFDYDVFWADAAGVPDAEGWYQLPLRTQRRTRETMAAHKRAQYMRRYQLMDAWASQIRAQLLGDSVAAA
jgi:uncharacterized protein VirK/YbjX